MTRQEAERLPPGTEIMIRAICSGLIVSPFDQPRKGILWIVDSDGIGASLEDGGDGIIVNVPFAQAYLPVSSVLKNDPPRILELVRLQQHVAIQTDSSRPPKN